jgi:hypothetical protein
VPESDQESDQESDVEGVLVGSDKIVEEHQVRAITTNLMARMVTLFESHPYVCSMLAKAELRTILWKAIVGSEVLAKVDNMGSAMAVYRTNCEEMGVRHLNAAHSHPKDLRVMLARTSREWCYMKHTQMWRLMSEHKPLEEVDWESPTLDANLADKFYAIRPDCPEGKGCNRCDGGGECDFCGGERQWLQELPDDGGIDFTPCLEYSVLKPQTENDNAIDMSTPGFQKLLVQFEAIKQIGFSAVDFTDGQASLRRKDVDAAFLAITRALMHKPGTDYEVVEDGTKFDSQVAERVYSLDGFTTGLGGVSAPSGPHNASMVVPSRLLIQGNIRRGKGVEDLQKSAPLTMPLGELVQLNPSFLADVNKAVDSLSEAGRAVRPLGLINELASTYTETAAHRLVHEYLPLQATANKSDAARARAVCREFEEIGSNPNPPSAKKARKVLKALDPWGPTTISFEDQVYDFNQGFIHADVAFWYIKPQPVFIKWGGHFRTQVPVLDSVLKYKPDPGGRRVERQVYNHVDLRDEIQAEEEGEDEASEDEARSQGNEGHEGDKGDGKDDEDEASEDEASEDEASEDDGDKDDIDDEFERHKKKEHNKWVKRMNGWQVKG